jgi:hypothetical protein
LCICDSYLEDNFSWRKKFNHGMAETRGLKVWAWRYFVGLKLLCRFMVSTQRNFTCIICYIVNSQTPESLFKHRHVLKRRGEYSKGRRYTITSTRCFRPHPVRCPANYCRWLIGNGGSRLNLSRNLSRKLDFPLIDTLGLQWEVYFIGLISEVRKINFIPPNNNCCKHVLYNIYAV